MKVTFRVINRPYYGAYGLLIFKGGIQNEYDNQTEC